jgi:hypothetical protein
MKSAIGFVALLAMATVARAESVKLVDTRPNQPPTYCRSEQDYAHRLSGLDEGETADYFEYKSLKLSLVHGIVTVEGQVTFFNCSRLAGGKYGWVARKAGQDHYNWLGAPRMALDDFVTRFLASVDPVTLKFKLEQPIEQFLAVADVKKFRAGKPVRAIEIFTTFLPPSYRVIRQNSQNPAHRLIVDFLP